MADNEGSNWATAKAVAAWIWDNSESILKRLSLVRSWFRSGKGTEESPGILILGPGGAGKSTLARMLSEENYNPLLRLPGEYQESIGVETYTLTDSPGVTIVVPPGQEHRRAATWADLHSDLAAGKFRGIILLVANGHDSFMLSYKQHRLYQNDKDRFVEDFCSDQRAEELTILKQLAPHLTASRGKVWLLTLVTKQDLWWPRHVEAEKHYLEGEYNVEIQRIRGQRGAQQFRHETVFASLVISNFLTGKAEQLKPNAAGYDQALQIKSWRRLIETIDSLREWEAGS